MYVWWHTEKPVSCIKSSFHNTGALEPPTPSSHIITKTIIPWPFMKYLKLQNMSLSDWVWGMVIKLASKMAACALWLFYMCAYETIYYEHQHCTLRFSNHIFHYSCLFTRLIPLQKNKYLHSVSSRNKISQTSGWYRCLGCWHIM